MVTKIWIFPGPKKDGLLAIAIKENANSRLMSQIHVCQPKMYSPDEWWNSERCFELSLTKYKIWKCGIQNMKICFRSVPFKIWGIRLLGQLVSRLGPKQPNSSHLRSKTQISTSSLTRSFTTMTCKNMQMLLTKLRSEEIRFFTNHSTTD